MLRKLDKRAQTTAEYAILFALVVGAVVAMQVYVKRGIQGRVRDVVNDIDFAGDLAKGQAKQLSAILTGDQFEPDYAGGATSSNQTSNDTENVTKGGAVAKGSATTTTANRTQNVAKPK